MPIRRKAATSPKDPPPNKAPEGEPDAGSEESASMGEAPEAAPAPPAEEAEGEVVNGEGERTEAGEAEAKEEKAPEGGEGEKKEEQDAGKGKEKEKKVKKTIPAWATVSASKRAKTQKGHATLYGHPKLDDILLEAIKACKDRSGASAYAVMKYITNKYDMLDLDKRKFLLRKALNRLIEKRIVKQLKGKGFSGSFTIDKLPPKATSDKPVVAPGVKAETLGDSLPLIITRLCEPKEASYMLIKKYLEQHFPKLNVEHRPDLLKGALQRAVEKGYLEQITGKGASGTFQLKRSGDKHLLKGGALEDAVLTAITAMNEPKSCSTTLLRKFLVESHKDIKAYMLVNNLKRTLKRCKMLGWMEQVTGSGLNGTYQLCYPYYPSPAILFPDKQTKESEEEDSEEEEEEEEEDSEEEDDESEDEPPPRKRSRQQKRPPSKVRHPPSAKKRRPANQRGRGRRPAPIKSLAASVKKPAKKPAPPAKKAVPPPKKSKPVPSRKSSPPAKATAAKATAAKATAAKATAAKATAAKATAAKATAAKATPAKATPVKKAAPASKPKTPVAKKMTSRAPTKSAAKKSPAPKAPPQSAVKAKPAARKSLRSRK